MGLMRKTLSMCTLGLVRFRNRDERMERFARQTRNAARLANVQRGQSLELQRDRLAQADVHHVDRQSGGAVSGLARQPVVVPAGWYPDAQGTIRWFDGFRWTEHTWVGAR